MSPLQWSFSGSPHSIFLGGGLSFVLDQLPQEQLPRFVVPCIAAAALDLPGGLFLHPPHPCIFQEALPHFSLSVGPPRQGKTGGPWEWRHQIVLSETVLFPAETHWCFSSSSFQ